MLVLSRKQSETIHIGDDIVIQVVRIGPNSVRIGITAPKDVRVIRSELDAEHATLIRNALNASSVGGLKSPVGP